ncbi:TonB-dependent receptor domain-containing protein [Ferrimonas senticii]|uniref:TonB-dependent receptor domain-containing protein n=1 Tax=Ferrimonas senticii TaxID=394566 RepID=UPI00041B890F|nr:TonB-dependent receptor [Ferrimonas senticii]
MLKSALTAYLTDYDNFIINTADFSNPAYPFGQYQYNNVDQARIKGIEAQAQWWLDFIAEGLALNLAAAYSDGENRTEDQPLNSIVPLNATVSLSYLDPQDRFGGSIDGRFDASKDRDNVADAFDGFTDSEIDPYQTAGYAIIDLNGHYNITPQVTLRGGIFNLLDKKYIQWIDVAGIEAGRSNIDRYNQPGRYVGASLSYQF